MTVAGYEDCPQAHHFVVAWCANPNCGPHIIGVDVNDKPMCEIVMTPDSAVAFIKNVQTELYKKAVRKI